MLCPVQGPAAFGPKLGGFVKVANAVTVRGGASRLSCKTRVGVDKAEAANLEVRFMKTQPTACVGTRSFLAHAMSMHKFAFSTLHIVLVSSMIQSIRPQALAQP